MATVMEMTTRIQQDPGLREALEAAAGQDGRIAAFRAAGLDVSPQDLTDAEAAAEQDELSDADLEEVAGGAILYDSLAVLKRPDCLFRPAALACAAHSRQQPARTGASPLVPGRRPGVLIVNSQSPR